MAIALAQWTVWLLTAYVVIGVVLGAAFVWRGVQHIDPSARDGTIGFRLLIFPGCVALWPLILQRWRSSKNTPPSECNTHRRAATPPQRKP